MFSDALDRLYEIKPSIKGLGISLSRTRPSMSRSPAASNRLSKRIVAKTRRATEQAGPPLHSHTWDEAYFVIAGVLRVTVGDKAHDLAVGGFAHIPAGSYHNYAGVGGPARFVSITSQPAAARFFADLDHEVPTVPPDLPALLAVAERAPGETRNAAKACRCGRCVRFRHSRARRSDDRLRHQR